LVDVQKDNEPVFCEVSMKLHSVQLCAVALLLPGSKITMACVYRCHGAEATDDRALIGALNLLVQGSAKLYIVGDFNSPNIDRMAGDNPAAFGDAFYCRCSGH
uniref:Endo/exonuclease/phosphatase domain-containing protein n=1 Tax=Echinostoma caproni TaxID=27848 RepID=A0A183BDY8_9TREM